MGKTESCFNILETAIQSQASLRDEEQKSALFSVYRALLETLFYAGVDQQLYVERVLKAIARLLPTKDIDSGVETFLADGVKSFLNHEPSQDERDDYFMPNLDCDKIVCYALFLYVKKKPISEVCSLFDLCLEHTESGSNLQVIFGDCGGLGIVFYKFGFFLGTIVREQNWDLAIALGEVSRGSRGSENNCERKFEDVWK